MKEGGRLINIEDKPWLQLENRLEGKKERM